MWAVYKDVPEDYVNGYGYAIATGSALVMNLFQERCLHREWGNGVAANLAGKLCAFYIDY